MVHAPRNTPLVAGVERFSRSAMYAKKALYKKQKTTIVAAAPKPAADTKTTAKNVDVKGANTRVVAVKKLPKYYPAEDVPKPKASRKSAKPTKLRPSLVPGTVVVLLAGRFRGKRVVFLKQLPSGLLLVTGPYKVNGVPLRRVNQAYVLATSTKVDVSKLKLSDKLDDSLFTKKSADKKQNKKTPTEEGLFEAGQATTKTPMDPVRVAEQKAVDAALMAEIKKVPQLKAYLNASFSLSNGQYPHMLKF